MTVIDAESQIVLFIYLLLLLFFFWGGGGGNQYKALKPYIVLVNLNEFLSFFQKVQHSHSRHQKTTSNFLRINLKGILKFNEIWPLEGATCMYIIFFMVEFSGTPRKCLFYAIFSEY